VEKDAKGVINQAARWLHSICAPAEARTLTEFAARYGDEGFQTSVADFMEGSFGRHDTVMGEVTWHDPSFIKGLAGARKQCLSKKNPGLEHLPPINPQTQVQKRRIGIVKDHSAI